MPRGRRTLQRKGPGVTPAQKGKAAIAAAKAKPPPFPFAKSCDLKIPVEGSAPGLEAKAAKEVEDIEWIDGVTRSSTSSLENHDAWAVEIGAKMTAQLPAMV
jgi:hypothetical protein